MTQHIHVPGGRRSRGSLSGLSTDKTGSRVFVDSEYSIQNEIDDARAKTQARACFTVCQTCGQCKNSCRDSTYPKSYDHNVGKNIDCRGCESFRFCDCRNGFYRTVRQEAEPFTESHLSLIETAENKRPLM